MQYLRAKEFYDINWTLFGIFGTFCALVLSGFIAVITGKLFRKSLRLGPIFVGIGLGICLILMSMPFLEWTIQLFVNFDFEFWISTILILAGAIFGAYLGYRLAYIILVSTQAFISAYLIVRGISLNLGGFPNEILIIKDLFGITKTEQGD